MKVKDLIQVLLKAKNFGSDVVIRIGNIDIEGMFDAKGECLTVSSFEENGKLIILAVEDE